MNMILNYWLLGAGVAIATCESGEEVRFESAQLHMGTKFIVVLYAPDQEVANRAFQAAFARIAQLDRVLSDYKTDSELNRLSRQAPTGQPVPLGPDLFAVLNQAQAISRQSQGAFDVTVGPLTKLWRRARRRRELPSPERLRDALKAVGYQYLVLDPRHKTASLTRDKMRLDLGGIAKGYAVDQALAALHEVGIDRALVNASGDMAASDAPPGSRGWRVALAPLRPRQPPSRFGLLANGAFATSGDAFQYIEIDGVRYSHIVDPRTGLGLTLRSSVSILADRCTVADALASAVSVLGPQHGLKLIGGTPGVEAFIVAKNNNRTTTYQTPGFRAWLLPPRPESQAPVRAEEDGEHHEQTERRENKLN